MKKLILLFLLMPILAFAGDTPSMPLYETVIADASSYQIEKLFQAKYEALHEMIQLELKRIETRLDGMDKALSLQGFEIERRFETANNLRNEYTSDREKDYQRLVTKETFDERGKVFVMRFERLEGDVDSLIIRTTVMETKNIIAIGILMFIFTVIQVLIQVWNLKNMKEFKRKKLEDECEEKQQGSTVTAGKSSHSITSET